MATASQKKKKAPVQDHKIGMDPLRLEKGMNERNVGEGGGGAVEQIKG